MLSMRFLTRKLIREGKRCFSLYHPLYASLDENQALIKKVKKSKGFHYVIDPDIAGEIASTIKKESDNIDNMIEINPGIGVLSTELAKLYNKLILIEQKEGYLSTLEKLKQTHENIEIGQDTTDYFLFDKSASFFFLKPPEVLDLVPKSSSPNDIVANVFIIVPPDAERLFSRTLAHSAMAMEGIYSQGRVNMFAIVPYRFKRRYEFANSSYSLTLKFELDILMELKFLMEIDLNSVFPKFPKKSAYGGNNKTVLIKITPKSNVNQILSFKESETFRLFSKQMLRNAEARIIPRMEQFFPHCGIYLIDIGFDMMQRFQDLNAEEFLKLFKSLSSIPDYEHSLWRQFLISEGHIQEVY